MTKAVKDEATFALLAERELYASASYSYAEFNPYQVSDASVVLDLVLDIGTDGLNYYERALPSDHTPDEWRAYRRMAGTLSVLFAHAAKIRRWEHGAPGRKYAGWHASGIAPKPDGGETHYHCLFCDANLQTLGHVSGGTVPRAFVAKMERHTHACAMRYLMTWCAS